MINCAPTPRELVYKYRTIFVHSPHFSIRNTFVAIFWKVPVKQSSVFSSSGIKFKVSAIHNGSSERTQMSPNPFKHAYFLLELNTGKRKWRKKEERKKAEAQCPADSITFVNVLWSSMNVVWNCSMSKYIFKCMFYIKISFITLFHTIFFFTLYVYTFLLYQPRKEKG